MRGNLSVVNFDDPFKGSDKFIKVDFVHDFQEYVDDITEIWSDEIDCYLMIKQLRDGKSCLNFYRHMVAVKMFANSIACSSQMFIVSEFKGSIFLIDPACSGLHNWII